MTHIHYTNCDRISEEAHGDVLSFITSENDLFPDLGFELLFNESNDPNFPVAGVCDLVTFTSKINLIKNKNLYLIFIYIDTLVNSVEPHELDGYLGMVNSASKK